MCKRLGVTTMAVLVLAAASCSKREGTDAADNPRVAYFRSIARDTSLTKGKAKMAKYQAPLPLAATVAEFARVRGADEAPAYTHALVDLNGDTQDDALVMLSGGKWCGVGGCEMLVLRGEGDHFVLVSRIHMTTPPVLALAGDERSNGWTTLIADSRGKGAVVLRFNGSRYPANAAAAPLATRAQLERAKPVLGAGGFGTTMTPEGEAVNYDCDDRSTLTIEVIPGAAGLARVSHRGESWLLPYVRAGAGEGARYSARGVSISSKGTDALFERGVKTLNCSAKNKL